MAFGDNPVGDEVSFAARPAVAPAFWRKHGEGKPGGGDLRSSQDISGSKRGTAETAQIAFAKTHGRGKFWKAKGVFVQSGLREKTRGGTPGGRGGVSWRARFPPAFLGGGPPTRGLRSGDNGGKRI